MASDEYVAPFIQLLGDDRDAHLLAALERIHEERCNEAIQVAIVYGARHMPAVVRHLRRRFGYWARDAEWMTIFERWKCEHNGMIRASGSVKLRCALGLGTALRILPRVGSRGERASGQRRSDHL